MGGGRENSVFDFGYIGNGLALNDYTLNAVYQYHVYTRARAWRMNITGLAAAAADDASEAKACSIRERVEAC